MWLPEPLAQAGARTSVRARDSQSYPQMEMLISLAAAQTGGRVKPAMTN